MDRFENLLKSAKNYLDSRKFSKAIELYEKALKKANPEEKAKIKRDLAFCLLRSGRLDLALKEAKEAEESFFRLGDDVELARARLLLANVMLEVGRSEEARGLSRGVYEFFKGTEHHKIVGLSQRLLGRAFAQLGDYGQAKDFFQDSLSAFRRVGDEGEILNSYNDLAFWGMATGDGGMALENLEKGLTISQRNTKMREEAALLGNMGTVYRKLGEWSKGEDYLRSSLELYEELNDTLEIARGLISLGRLMALRRELDYSEDLLNRALSLSQEHGYEREEAMSLESLGDLAKERGDLDLARDYYQRTLDIGRKLGQKDLINQVQRRRAELLVAEGKDLEEASRCIQEALKISQFLGDRSEEGCCYRVQALISEAQGNLEEAREGFEKAIRILRSIKEKFELGRTFLEQGRFTATALKEREQGLDLLQEADRLFSNMGPGCEYYRGLAKLEMAKVEPSLRSAVEHLRKAEDIFRAKGEEERLKEFEALKVEFNGKLTQPTARKYEFLRGLSSPDLGEIFEVVIREVRADRGFVVYRPDTSKGEIKIERKHNLTQGETKKLLSLIEDDNGFQPGESFILYDAALDDSFSSLGAGSLMITPFGSNKEGRIDGCLYVDRQRNKEPFLDKEYDLFYSLSERVGRTIYQKRQEELEEELRELKRSLKGSGVITHNPQMLKVLEVIELAKNSDIPILLTGETGTGKDFLTRIIHQGSARRDEGFIEIHCGAIPKDLVETELFGHEKGAFTGAISRKLGRLELAEGGTLFLNEVGELPEATQVKLLRFFDTNELERVGGNKTIRVNTRVIAATNKDLKVEVENGAFRNDLYYRLNVLCVELPPLRERKEDIPLLANHFIKLYGDKYEKKVQGMAPGVLRAMMEYDWPGNIRELENVIETMVIMAKQGEEITVELLPKGLRTTKFKGGDIQSFPRVRGTLKEVEKKVIQETLRKTKGSKYETSKLLGMGKSTLYRKVKEYGLS